MSPLRSKGRTGESTDEATEPERAPPFDPTTAAPLPPPPTMTGTAASEPAAPPAAGGDLQRGDVLGDYVIDSKIGRGGMGDVYLGVHPLIRKRAAIKLLRGDACRDQSAVARFIAEARIVNEIGHPNIVDVFAFGQTPDGRHYLAMECLKGETLRARIARGRLDVEETAAIIKPLVLALQAAHAKGVVHRDLKPDNVFLHAPAGGPPVVKLLDFGIAKLEEPGPGMEQTESGVMVGTPMYIAPEQARGATVDARADIYTLGGILFEMVTGAPPFLAATAFEVVAKHLMEPPVRASTRASIPRELDDLIDRMLAKSPDDRPSLAKVLEVLERLGDPGQRPTQELQTDRESVASIAITARRAAVAEPAPDEVARPRRVAIVALVAAIVAVAAIVVIMLVRRESPRATAHTSPAAVPAAVPPDAALPDAATADAPLPAASRPDAAPAVAPPRPRGTGTHEVQRKHEERREQPEKPAGSDDDEVLLPRGSVPK